MRVEFEKLLGVNIVSSGSRQGIQTEANLLVGFKSADSALRSLFRDFLWIAGNLSREQRQDLTVIGSHLVRCIDMLDLESTEGLPLDVWKEVRDEISDAFCGAPTTAELATFVHVIEKHQISKQFIFDMLNAVDYWIRFQKFETWQQLDTFASNLCGSATVMAAKLVRAENAGFEIPALACGKAVLLTQKLARCHFDLKANRNFLAQEDLARFKLEVHRLKMRQACPELKHFVRFTISRIEKVFYEAGRFVEHLEFGAARSVTSLLSVHWRMLTRMRREPELIYSPDGVLSRRDMLGLKSRHLLGTEGNIPIFEPPVH